MRAADEPVDAVYTWVDGQSPGFDCALSAVMGEDGQSGEPSTRTPARFRDNGELRYSLRSLELHAPWIRHVHIVTNGQVPAWLDRQNERVRIVSHNRLFKETDCLPTFNSNAIELQLHRIPGLSRRFLYFNDDVFLGRRCEAGDFIRGAEGQRLYFQSDPLPDDPDSGPVHDRAYAYTAGLLARRRRPRGGFRLPAHAPQLYDRDVIARLEHAFADDFARTARLRVRTCRDLVLRILYMFHLLDADDGAHDAVILDPGDDYRFLRLRDDPEVIADLERIGHSRPRFFCINDEIEDAGGQHVALCALRYLLEKMFPARSSFERDAPSSHAVFQREMWNQRLRHDWGPAGVGSLAYGIELNRWFYRVRSRVFRRVVRGLEVDMAGSRVLDVGSGTGFYLREWLAVGAVDLTGIDISDVAVARLRAELPAMTIRQADISRPPDDMNGRTFDLISALDVLFHVIDDDEYQQALTAMQYLLSPDGYLILSDNFLRGDTRSHGNYWKSRSRRVIGRALNRAGLELLTVEPMFVLMGSPVDTRTARPARLWDRLMKTAAARGLGGTLGGALYPLEIALLGCIPEGPSTKIAVCRRKRPRGGW